MDKSKLYKLCEDPHLTINCHKLAEANKLLSHTFSQKPPAMLSNPFPNWGQ